MFLISNAYAQTAAPASGGADLSFLYIAGLMLVVVFFTTMRPQMKKAKETKAMLEALAKGDEVVTIGGGVLGAASPSSGDTRCAHRDRQQRRQLQIQRSRDRPGPAQRRAR